MAYNSIKQRLENNDTIILDGAIGAELEKKGAKMHKDLWCGTCSVESPDLVKKVHEDYILAGADIITTNTYPTTPIAMKQYGFKDQINELLNYDMVVYNHTVIDILCKPRSSFTFQEIISTFSNGSITL